MALTALTIQGYRSLRDVRLPLGPLNVITGPNGAGKSNLYRVLWLLSRICEGDFAQSLAREGGLISALWAGPRTSTKPHRLVLGFQTDSYAYELSCGFPPPIPGEPSLFCYDAQIKDEAIWHGARRKPSTLMLERGIGHTRVRDVEGNRVDYPLALSENESVLSQLRDPQRFPELFSIRDEVRGWRFYHTFRTDDEAPLRSPQISVRTPVLSHDGRDLAAALQTIIEMGGQKYLDEAIDQALPGRQLEILSNSPDVRQKSPRLLELTVALHTAGCTRPLLARELSDGTLKYLCLVAALLTERPSGLIAL
ncbi:MAG: AAA family ATPase, partial [Planctomycetes bacterium]|nr:AAA family ATPase [Planctomycetota bacterium]